MNKCEVCNKVFEKRHEEYLCSKKCRKLKEKCIKKQKKFLNNLYNNLNKDTMEGHII